MSYSVSNVTYPINPSRKALSWLMFIVIAVTLLRVVLIAANIWPVNGDEAQYWSWGKHLAFGYYSKPPMVAWLIAATSAVFGNGYIGLRLASPLCHAVIAIMIFLTARRLFGNEKIALWSGISYILLPGVSFSADIISTDPALLMFWSITLYGFVRALEQDQMRWWAFSGIALGLAMLSKYAALFFPLSALLYFIFTPQHRSYLTSKGFWLSLFIALLVLSPNLIWNLQHGFVSVVAVKNNADLQGSLFHIGNMFSFLGSQIAIFGPVLFITLLMMFVRWRKVTEDSRIRMMLFFVFPVLFIMTLEGLLSRAHGNWAAPIYVAASIAVPACLIQMRKQYWLVVALVINIVALIGITQIQPLVRTFHIKMVERTTTLDWQKTGALIAAQIKQHPGSKLLIDSRMLLTKTMYYTGVPLKDTFKWNPKHLVRDQYDMVTHLQTQKGKNFVYVTYHPKRDDVFAYFNKHQLIKAIHSPTLDGRGIVIYVYYLQGFRGY